MVEGGFGQDLSLLGIGFGLLFLEGSSGSLLVDASFLRGRCRRSILLVLGLGRRVPHFRFLHKNRFVVLMLCLQPPPRPTFSPVCKEDIGSVAAPGAHSQCSRCDLVFHSKWRLCTHSCSSGDKLLTTRTIGTIATTDAYCWEAATHSVDHRH